jgi:uncharacterized protein YdaU (DUF1376 family)
MAEFPYLPLFTDAFLSDTIDLNVSETGAYLMLLMCMWRTPDCALPDDDKKLARFARCEPRQWKKIKPEIIRFFTVSNGRLQQKRLSKERLHVQQISASRSQSGAAGGQANALKYKKPAEANGYDLLKQKSSKTVAPIPIPIPKEEKVIAPKGKKGSRIPDDWGCTRTLADWGNQKGYSDGQIKSEEEKFKLHWEAATGARATKISWDKAFQSWMLNGYSVQPDKGGKAG